MTPGKSSTTRSSSTDSSALSNIDVALARQLDDGVASASASTPPTSLAESVNSSAKKTASPYKGAGADGAVSRPRRARPGAGTYNLKQLSDEAANASAVTSRNVSGLTGRTLVDGQRDEDEGSSGTPFGEKVEKALNMGWELPGESSTAHPAGKLQRKPSVKDRVKKVAGKVGSVLGKRGRGVVEAGRRALGGKKVEAEEPEDESEEEVEKPRWMKELDTGTKGLLDEIDLDADLPAPPPAKKARTLGKEPLREIAQPPASLPLAKASAASKRMKKWQREGLYVGQDPDFDPTQPGGRKKLQKKRPESSASDATMTNDAPIARRNSFLALPMFSYLDKTRDFTIPYDIFAPSYRKGDDKPKDWHQLNRNRLVGEAKDLWEKSERLPASMCVCSPPEPGHLVGCDDQCLNRVMQYECNDDNCNLPADECGNRAFSSLAIRMKKGGAFDVGVEVVKTANRGFGVRSCRSFGPGEIVMEYTGEIISEGECQRRMREEYKDKQCYYLMELERGLIIDGTKGSMARFINHSCEPNCEVRMVKVNGTPRMGVFAGEEGIVTGQELTYDYNFDNFGTTRQQCFCGASTCRGFLSKRLNATEQKKLLKEENERKRKAAEEAQKHAQDEDRKKKIKTERGSGWRGWVAVDDPETKERLRREKAEREEAEKSSSRAQRLAARRGSLPAVKDGKMAAGGKRRKTTTALEAEPEGDEDVLDVLAAADSLAAAAASPQKSLPAPVQPKHKRAVSSGSKFTEDLQRTSSVQSTATITRKTEISITETEVREESVSLLSQQNEIEGGKKEKKKKSGLLDAAAKVGQAVKGGLADALKGTGSGSGGGKLKQSTLSFTRVAQ